jgi:hypothetical protein
MNFELCFQIALKFSGGNSTLFSLPTYLNYTAGVSKWIDTTDVDQTNIVELLIRENFLINAERKIIFDVCGSFVDFGRFLI